MTLMLTVHWQHLSRTRRIFLLLMDSVAILMLPFLDLYCHFSEWDWTQPRVGMLLLLLHHKNLRSMLLLWQCHKFLEWMISYKWISSHRLNHCQMNTKTKARVGNIAPVQETGYINCCDFAKLGPATGDILKTTELNDSAAWSVFGFSGCFGYLYTNIATGVFSNLDENHDYDHNALSRIPPVDKVRRLMAQQNTPHLLPKFYELKILLKSRSRSGRPSLGDIFGPWLTWLGPNTHKHLESEIDKPFGWWMPKRKKRNIGGLSLCSQTILSAQSFIQYSWATGIIIFQLN